MLAYINPAYIDEGQEAMAKAFDEILGIHLPAWVKDCGQYFWEAALPEEDDFIEEAQKLAQHVESEYPNNAEGSAQ